MTRPPYKTRFAGRLLYRLERAPAALAIACVVISCTAIGWMDYATGAELRVFPLYFFPVAMAAWRFGRNASFAIASACALIWLGTNVAAGMTALPMWILAGNTLVQLLTFIALGWLLATNRALLDRERHLARTDQLTGVLNLRGFRERAELELRRAQRTSQPLTVACMDLDHFKAANDTRGHRAGDALLASIGALLLQRTRATDVAGRVGGDEFAILMPDTDRDGASVVLDAIRREVAAAAAQQAVPVTASIGAVINTTRPRDLDRLLREADAALYAAKHEGRNRVVVAGARHDAESAA